MEGLLSLLIFVGLFFVMMRFGCGAHMMHGHGKSHEHAGNTDNQQKHIDPVCGMEVDVEQGYGKMHKGALYRFCSRDCLDKFEKNPEQFISKNLTHDNHHEGSV